MYSKFIFTTSSGTDRHLICLSLYNAGIALHCAIVDFVNASFNAILHFNDSITMIWLNGFNRGVERFYYNIEKKCKASEPENAESLNRHYLMGRFSKCAKALSVTTVLIHPVISQSEESLYPIHSVTSCSTAEPESSMSFNDTSAKETHINDDDCIEVHHFSST